MKIKKSYFWLMLDSSWILIASAAFVYPDFALHPDFAKNTAQADRSETAINGIKSSSSIVTRVQPSDPLEILTAGAAATGFRH